MARKRSPKQVAKTLKIEERRAQAMQLKLMGWSYREIGKKLGVSVKTAFLDVEAVLERTKFEADGYAQRERKVTLGRLDMAVRGLMPAVSKGNSRSAEVLAKIEERRAKLIGLDAPERRVVDATVSEFEATPEAAARHARELFGMQAAKPEASGGPAESIPEVAP